MRGLQKQAVIETSGIGEEEFDRFLVAHRIYLETSAFNYFFENIAIPELELTRAYHKRKGVMFITSPVLLWEIMLNSNRQKADEMLLAAQTLFDPLLLATPTELAVRYLKHAYPNNTVNYSCFSDVSWAKLWRPMTEDFRRTLNYDYDDLLKKTKPFRDISKNLEHVIAGRVHGDDVIDTTMQYVCTVYLAIRSDLEVWKVDEITAKFVILYVFLFLVVFADLDGEEVRKFWADKDFHSLEWVMEVFTDYPEIFLRGPILEMATMSSLQYRSKNTNRGVLHDGMHMVYAPYVNAILSNDGAFLDLSKKHNFYSGRVVHLSDLEFFTRKLSLEDYPDDQKSRSL